MSAERPIVMTPRLDVAPASVRVRGYYHCTCGVEVYIDKHVWVEGQDRIVCTNGRCWSCDTQHIVSIPFEVEQKHGRYPAPERP